MNNKNYIDLFDYFRDDSLNLVEGLDLPELKHLYNLNNLNNEFLKLLQNIKNL